ILWKLGRTETWKQSFRPPLRGFGESLFFACAKKSNQKKAHPGREPADEAGRSPARLASMGAGPQLASLRHVGLSAPIAAAMLGSLYGEGKQQQQQQQRQRQRQGAVLRSGFGGTARTCAEGRRFRQVP